MTTSQEIADIQAALNKPGVSTQQVAEAEKLARKFHENYERLASAFGYKTREESAKPWEEVPEQNRKLMIAVCVDILANGYQQSTTEPKRGVGHDGTYG